MSAADDQRARMAFDRYTDRARRVLVIAQDEARKLGHTRVETMHLLLGLIGEDGGVAARALKSMGAAMEDARQVVSRTGGRSTVLATSFPFTPALAKVLNEATREAVMLGNPYIATEHLLLALAAGSPPGASPLVAIGVNPDDARAKVLELLRGYEEAPKGKTAAEPVASSEGDDRLTAALEEISGNIAKAERAGMGRDLDQVIYTHGLMTGTSRRFLAALDAVLRLHQPRQLYGFIADENHPDRCPHDADGDWDQHFEGDDGMWYCHARPTVQVCTSCADGPDGDTWAEWPCPTYKAITRELTAEGK